MLKAVIAGCGFISKKKHIPAFLKLKNKVNLVAVCDLSIDAASEAARQFGVRNHYSDFLEMLRIEQPDIVDICTPPQTHAKLTVEALNCGANVILEKPMAPNISDCDLMIDAALKNKKALGVIHNQIFNPAFTKARSILLRGDIGGFLGLQIFLSTPTDYMTSIEGHWSHKLPGGVLGETGPHSVYLASAFLKNIYDVDVFSKKMLNEYPWSKFEDFRFILLAENGMASVTQTYASNQWAAYVDILGTNGILRVDLQSKSVLKYSRTKLKASVVGMSLLQNGFMSFRDLFANGFDFLLGKKQDAHSIAIAEFVNSVSSNSPFAVTGEDGRETVKVMKLLVDKLNQKSGINC